MIHECGSRMRLIRPLPQHCRFEGRCFWIVSVCEHRDAQRATRLSSPSNLSSSPSKQLGEPHQDETSQTGRAGFPISLSAAASMCQVSRRSREATGPLASSSWWIGRARKIQEPKTRRTRRHRLQTALAKTMTRAIVPTFGSLTCAVDLWRAEREPGRGGQEAHAGRPCPQQRRAHPTLLAVYVD